MKPIIKRLKSKTPKFFNKVKIVGASLIGVSAAIVAAPIALPAILSAAAGYIALSGGVMVAMGQLTQLHEDE